MGLSKALGAINRSLVLAKLDAYRFSSNSLKFLQSYLSNIFQRTHINSSFNNLAENKCWSLNSLYHILLLINNTYLCKNADDNTLYTTGKILSKLKLHRQSSRFYKNGFKKIKCSSAWSMSVHNF